MSTNKHNIPREDSNSPPSHKEPASLLFPSFNINLNMNRNTINSFIVQPDDICTAFNEILTPQSPGAPVISIPMPNRKGLRNFRPVQPHIQHTVGNLTVSYDSSKQKRSASVIKNTSQSRTESKKSENRHIDSRNVAHDQLLKTQKIANIQLAGSDSTKGRRKVTITTVPPSTKSKLHDPISIYQNVARFIKKQNISVKQTNRKSPEKLQEKIVHKNTETNENLEIIEKLQSKLQELELKKSNLSKEVSKRTEEKIQFNKYKELSLKLENDYEKYSELAHKTLTQKQNEDRAFEKFITVCQEKEKIAVDNKLLLSHQRMKIKLLQETLVKRAQEFENMQLQNKELSNMLEGYEEKMKEIYEIGCSYESKVLYF